MPLSNVTKVVKIDDDTMDVTVQAYGFSPGEYVLVTGSAMQEHGAYATFQDTQVIEQAGPEDIPLVTIRATKAPDTKEFQLSKRITVVAQLHWTSFLEQPQNPSGKVDNNTWLPV